MTFRFDRSTHFYWRPLNLLLRIVTLTDDHIKTHDRNIHTFARTHVRPPALLPHVRNVARSTYYELEHLASTLRKLRGLFAPRPATDHLSHLLVLKHTRRKHQRLEVAFSETVSLKTFESLKQTEETEKGQSVFVSFSIKSEYLYVN